jgi:tRNA (adenine57-N1/adenine58-N1)-methyltransferase
VIDAAAGVQPEFVAGGPCMLHDAKGRRYLIELVPGRQFHSHRGMIEHDELIGAVDGSVHLTTLGERYVALLPTLADYVLKMGRRATVSYPKDIGAILVAGDIGPEMTVLEAGTGSGGLTMALARAVGPTGRVVSYERRADHAAVAARLIAGFSGTVPDQVDLRVGEVEEAFDDVSPDRVVLDLPEPWHLARLAASRLRPGGVFLCYLPTVPQVQTVVDELRASGGFFAVETFEVLHRQWVIDGRSVRPSHRMVGHTGFITTGRRVSPPPPGEDEGFPSPLGGGVPTEEAGRGFPSPLGGGVPTKEAGRGEI